MSHNVGAVMLAAGFSNRFGSIKICAGLASGRNVFQQTLFNIRSSIPDVLVVTREEVYPLLEAQDVEIAIFEDAERGMGATLAYAAGQLLERKRWDGCLVCLADMPFICPATYLTIAESLRHDNIVLPLYQGRIGNPAAFGRDFFQNLTHLTGDRGGRTLVRQHPQATLHLPVEDPAILQDIDTPEDLAKYDTGS